MLFTVKYRALRATVLVSRDAYIRPFCFADTCEQSGAVGGRVLQDEWFRDDVDDDDGVDDADSGRVSRALPLAAPTVNGSGIESGAEEENGREREKEGKGELAGNDGVSVYRAQRGAK